MPLLVASAIFERDGKILAGKRKGYNDGYNGLYCTPGGKVENGEPALKCAIRETKEETDLDIKELVTIGTTYPPGFIITFFLVLKYEGYPETREPNKCEEWEWIDWNQRMTPGLVLLRATDLWFEYQRLQLIHAHKLEKLCGCPEAQKQDKTYCSHPHCNICYGRHVT